MQCQLKNVKVNEALSEETTCFSATLYIDGKKAAQVSDRGQGGETEFRFQDRQLEKAFYDHCKSLPPLPARNGLPALEMNAGLFVGELLDQYEEHKFLVRWCKKDIVYRLKGDKPGSWRIVKNHPWTPEAKQKLTEVHGDKLERIGNEEI